ncbi:MAG TPA: hypothetical protein VFQ27_11765 [Xanthobacteraceae bacterium]|nr:hypothetical protein [Xanthobacteraceae bacterium]
MFLIGFPLLIIPLAIYNIVAFLMPVEWTSPLFSISMMSGGQWTVTFSDLLLALGLLFLFLEIFKATRHGTRAIVDHLLSTLVFIAALIEFLLVDRAASSTFALLMAMCLVDMAAGFSVSIRTAQRDYTIAREEV